ncbi:hypothetical protein J6590_067587 [Homalodisca vitripennis]|nr:hypothetical protein J6590_067587 [Homalodisca vitripennis]
MKAVLWCGYVKHTQSTAGPMLLAEVCLNLMNGSRESEDVETNHIRHVDWAGNGIRLAISRITLCWAALVFPRHLDDIQFFGVGPMLLAEVCLNLMNGSRESEDVETNHIRHVDWAGNGIRLAISRITLCWAALVFPRHLDDVQFFGVDM